MTGLDTAKHSSFKPEEHKWHQLQSLSIPAPSESRHYTGYGPGSDTDVIGWLEDEDDEEALVVREAKGLCTGLRA
jgi:hypothetical protein